MRGTPGTEAGGSRLQAEERPTRRSAVIGVAAGVLALASGALALAAGFVSNAWRQRRERPWLRAGSTAELPEEGFVSRELEVERSHAWTRETVPLIAFLRGRVGAEPMALHARCTHLGCTVRWSAGERRFLCPCHGGVYDEEGRVIAGPPPRDLARLEVRVEQGELFVRPPWDGEIAG